MDEELRDYWWGHPGRLQRAGEKGFVRGQRAAKRSSTN